MMYHLLVPMSVILALLLCSQPAVGQDDDDEVKGPLMPVKPDGGLYTTAELVEKHGYKSETHLVTTDDGYILTVFRIVPKAQPAPVVLIQHGFMSSSDCWVTDKEALAFKMSDAGFDVWLSNVRGNAYSRKHVNRKTDTKEFWNFSFHEMGTMDMPALVTHVLKASGQPKLHLVGHSMGTTIGFLYLSHQAESFSMLRSFHALAPVVFLSKMTEMVGPDGMAGEIAADYMKKFRESGKLEVFPRKDLANSEKTQITCEDVGESYVEMCKDKMEEGTTVLGGAYIPAGQSLKTLAHFYQMAYYGVMKHFNMSVEENKAAYGSEKPPGYTDKFKDIKVPLALWWTPNDQFTNDKDIEDLVPLLPTMVSNNKIEEECFDHVAFLFPRYKSCIPVREKLYTNLIEAIKKLDTK